MADWGRRYLEPLLYGGLGAVCHGEHLAGVLVPADEHGGDLGGDRLHLWGTVTARILWRIGFLSQ